MPDQFRVEYAGMDTAESGMGTQFYGGLLAFPNGTIELNSNADWVGAFIAKKITTGTGVNVTLSSPSPFGP